MSQRLEKPIPEDFRQDFEALFHDPQPIEMELSKYQAWCLLSAVQLARRHPEARQSTVLRQAVAIVERLQAAIATTPALQRIADQGWRDTE